MKPLRFLIVLICTGLLVVSVRRWATSTAKASDQNGSLPVQSVSILPISYSCSNSVHHPGFTYALTRAFVISQMPDVRTHDYYFLERTAPDIGLEKFLFIEAQATNTQTKKTDIDHLEMLLRLVRPGGVYMPMHMTACPGYQKSGCTPLQPGENRTVRAVFPIRSDETAFSLLFCSFKTNPTHIALDFSKAPTYQGIYSYPNGLMVSQ